MDVKALRRQLGLTQEALAKKLPVEKRTIQRWERREVTPHRLGMQRLKDIAKEWHQRQAMTDPPPAKRMLHAELDDGDD